MAHFYVTIEGNSIEGVCDWKITFATNPKEDNQAQFAFNSKVNKAIAEAIKNIEDENYY